MRAPAGRVRGGGGAADYIAQIKNNTQTLRMECGVMTLGEGACWQGEESWRDRGFRVMTGVLRMVSASAVMKRDSLLTKTYFYRQYWLSTNK